MKPLRWTSITIAILALWIGGPSAQGSHVKRTAASNPKTPKDSAIEFCRVQALARFKYQKTVEWEATAKDEGNGLFLVVGFRDAKTPEGQTVTQQATCRVEKVRSGWKLKLIQIFKEASRTGKEIFETYR
jgi:hypothetical protein